MERFRTSAMNSALWYLTRQDRSRKEIEDRLKKRGDLPPTIIQFTLDKLEGQNFLNDQRYADNLARRGMEYRSLGKSRIRQDMRQRGLDAEIIEETLSTIDEDTEEQNARAFLDKRAEQVRNWDDPYKVRNSLVGALARRGYAPGLAYRLVNEYIKARPDGEEVEELEDDSF
jgi:regulatory protein